MGDSPFPPGRWRARWIWCESPRLELRAAAAIPSPRLDAEASRRLGAFRRTFDLAVVPAEAPARVTADSRYVLWVNGVELARGPIRSHPAKLHYDVVDVAPVLRRGRNVIAILARFYGRPTPWWMPARPAGQLGAGAVLFEARIGEGLWLSSDAAWRCLAIAGWEASARRGIGGMSAECIDARRVPHGWQEVEYDDSQAAGWGAAIELTTFHVGFQGQHQPPSQPYGAMRARPIALLSRRRRTAVTCTVEIAGDGGQEAHPVDQVARDAEGAMPAAGGGAAAEIDLDAVPGKVHLLRFDFGEVVCGTVVLDLDAPQGTRLDLSASEFADPAAEPGGEHMQLGMRYTARGVADRIETFDPIGFRYATVSVRSSAGVRLRPPAVHERLYPRAPGPYFECSDATLNRIWRVGRRTVDLNSHDAYLDCPTREQRAWTGDFVVHQMVDLLTNPDWRLARHHVELAASPRPDGMLPMAAGGDIEHQDAAFIPDWALHWVRALHNLYRYGADAEFAARMMPVAENVLRWFVPYLGADGLLADVNGWVLIDWSSVSAGGRSSCLNALWARALLDFADLADGLGDGARAAWARRLWSRLRAAFAAFWDGERAAYADVIAAGGKASPLSQHAQAAALCAGLVPEERVAALVALLTDRSRLVHAAWSVPGGDARRPQPGEGGIGGPYLLLGPPEPWWDVETAVVAAQPFFRYVVHDALALAGRADLVAAACLDWGELLDRCPTSFSETWFGGTTCHGWSATPTRDLLLYTLGISPAQPGYARARVAPRLGFLEWARGAVPTPRGLLSVDVDRERIVVDSPVPFDLDVHGAAAMAKEAGRHEERVASR
jgi:hypothetical protein